MHPGDRVPAPSRQRDAGSLLQNVALIMYTFCGKRCITKAIRFSSLFPTVFLLERKVKTVTIIVPLPLPTVSPRTDAKN